jgi:hypothetical protein
MKKKIFAALTVMFALSLALTVYAINQSSPVAVKSAADNCAQKDSCPMKNKQAQSETATCCDRADCCCKNADSCPMRMNGEKTSEGKKNCCKGDVCPMKKDAQKQTASAVSENETVAAGSVK